MPGKEGDLHGNVPDKSSVALLLVDVINDMEFPGGEDLIEHALPAARRIAALKERVKALDIPVVYVNDNFGRWRSDFRMLLAHTLEADMRGRPVAEILRPDEDDYIVLKPKHSGFYASMLETVLSYLQTTTIILTGFAGDRCILFTASDAFLRDYHIVVPADCVASEDPAENDHALAMMARLLRAEITVSTELDLDGIQQLAREARRGAAPWRGSSASAP